MNAERRKTIAQALAVVTSARVMLEEQRDAEQEAFDALPESLREGERGEAMESAIDTLQAAIDELENVESELDGLAQG